MLPHIYPWRTGIKGDAICFYHSTGSELPTSLVN